MIDRLSLLVGNWSGKGVAAYPTIETTKYFDELSFRFTGDENTISFFQNTWYDINGEKGNALHSESGYFIYNSEDSLEFVNVQNNGRTEVMKASAITVNEDSLKMMFESVNFGNDEKMVKSVREFKIEGPILTYEMKMQTRSISKPEKHLHSVLRKSKIWKLN